MLRGSAHCENVWQIKYAVSFEHVQTTGLDVYLVTESSSHTLRVTTKYSKQHVAELSSCL